MNNNVSNKNNITEHMLSQLGVEIEKYLELFKEVMILPKKEKDRKEVLDAIETTKKLIKKLKKGDTSVLKDEDTVIGNVYPIIGKYK